jgi:protein ImuB
MFATIYLPNFFLQAAIRHQQIPVCTPVALIDEQEKKPVIIQLNDAAEHVGVRIGMAPSQGLARCLQLQIKCRSSAKEAAATNLVLQYCFSLTPYVETTAPGIWTVQFTRAEKLSDKISTLVHDLAGCELTAQAGIATTPDMSFLAAHLGRPVLQIDHAEEFLAPLAIDILAT